MWTKDNIYEELKEIAPVLAGVPRINVYRVDESYFNSLADNILSVVQPLHSLPVKATTPAFSVPDGYFDGLAGSILNKIKSTENSKVDEELAEIAPTLAAAPKVNVYRIPAGYFEAFTVEKPQAKVVRLKAVKRVYSYVAAAIIFAIICISAFLFLDKPSTTVTASQPPAVEQNLSAAVSTLSEADIESYLHDQNIADVSMPAIVIPDSDFNVKEVIQELTEEELQQFLKQNPAPASAPKQDS